MNKLTAILVIGILATLLLLPSTTHAQPNVCGFYGTVTLDGALVEDGTLVKAWIDREEVASTTTYTNTDVDPPIHSYYSFTIDGTGNDFEGKVVVFTVGEDDVMVAERGIFEKGANIALNLNSAHMGPQIGSPTIALIPNKANATNVCGHDFAWNMLVNVYFDEEPYATIMANDKGAFCIPLIPPTTEYDQHYISAVDALGRSAGATFTIPAPVISEPPQGKQGPTGEPGEPGAPGEKGKDANPTTSFIGLIVAIIAAILVMVMGRRSKTKKPT